MQRLLTITYPELPADSEALIDGFRSHHDAERRARVEPHFTMVFGCTAIGQHEYTVHVATVARDSRPIEFTCKYAMLGADDEDDTGYVFLVPDQGFAEISLLHDRLYTGLLQPYLRLDLPYIPHITIGTLKNRAEAKALCDELNRQSVCVKGRVTKLAIGCIDSGKFTNLSTHRLGEA